MKLYELPKYWLVILLTLVSAWPLLSQRPGDRTPISDFGGTNRGGNRTPGNQREIAPDTFGLFIFQVDNPTDERPFADSVLLDFHQYDQLRRQTYDYQYLGIIGSAHRPLVYQPQLHGGFDLGIHQYDLYYTTGNSLNYYRLERPFTDLSFIQGSEQADNVVKAVFSRNFAKGLNFVIDYRAITQTGEADQYPNQSNQTRALATGFWFHGKNNRYDGFLSYAANTTNHEDNGGLITLPETGGEFTTPASAETFLTDGLTRHALRELMYTQYFRFGGRTDSTGQSSRAFTLSHQIAYSNNTYRYADPFGTTDTSFYNWFPDLLLDDRGSRYYLEHRSITNSFKLSTYRLAAGRRDQQRQQRDLLEVGLEHRYHRLHQEPLDSTLNNILLTGRFGLRPNARLNLQVDALLAVFDQAGDFRVTGQLEIDLGKAGKLQLGANNQLYTPALSQNRWLITQKTAWQHNFRRTLETNLNAAYTIPGIQLGLAGQYTLLDNYIYFDTSGLPIQLDKALSIAQLTLSKDFHLGRFHFENRIVFQTASEQVVRLPDFYGNHSLYYTGQWFKVLAVQCGFDLRYTTAYQAYYYNPVTGQFNLQNRQQLDFYPNIDGYFSMKVTKFRAFVKWENLTSLFRPDERFFLTAFYPNPGAALRIGISWRMLD